MPAGCTLTSARSMNDLQRILAEDFADSASAVHRASRQSAPADPAPRNVNPDPLNTSKRPTVEQHEQQKQAQQQDQDADDDVVEVPPPKRKRKSRAAAATSSTKTAAPQQQSQMPNPQNRSILQELLDDHLPRKKQLGAFPPDQHNNSGQSSELFLLL